MPAASRDAAWVRIANCNAGELFAEGRFADPRGAVSFQPGSLRPRFVLRYQAADCHRRGVARVGPFPSAIRKQPLLACSMLTVVVVTGSSRLKFREFGRGR